MANRNPGKRAKIDYGFLINASGDAIIAVDVAGRIIMWNPAAEKMFGYNRSEAMRLAFLIS